MNHSDTISTISTALLAAQKAMGLVVKDKKNPFFKSSYADINALLASCKTALNRNDVFVSQPISGDYVKTLLVHSSGEWMEDELGAKIICAKPNDPQAYGSAVTYARRYGLGSILAMESEDDDGERAMDRKPAVPRAQPARAVVKPFENSPTAEETTRMRALTKICAVHGVHMINAWSVSSRKWYFSHRSLNGEICYGMGYKPKNTT